MKDKKLGHLIRRYRVKQPDVINQKDMKKILYATDLGLY